MPTVQQPKRAPEFVPGKKNQVTAMVPVQMYAVNFVNGDSQKSMALILVFGKDTEDGGPGVFVLADENQMAQQILVANETVKKGVRAHLAKMAGPSADEIPDGGGLVAGQIDMTGDADDAGAGPADLTKMDLG